nr:uncharacterized protein LOC128690254 [Cherax quadricarinatus]
MAAERPAYPWLSPPSSRAALRPEERSPTLSLGSSHTLGSTLSLPLCAERSSSSSRASSRASSTSSSSWSSQWSWGTLLSNASVSEALVPPEACLLPCTYIHTKGLVQGRDGGRSGAGYMNLPSPNVAAEVSFKLHIYT